MPSAQYYCIIQISFDLRPSVQVHLLIGRFEIHPLQENSVHTIHWWYDNLSAATIRNFLRVNRATTPQNFTIKVVVTAPPSTTIVGLRFQIFAAIHPISYKLVQTPIIHHYLFCLASYLSCNKSQLFLAGRDSFQNCTILKLRFCY